MLKKAYEQLRKSYDKLNKPTGAKDSPARTCNELSMAKPELGSGEYWIDPNDGDKNDAILVYCDMPKRATCVKAQPQRSKNIQYVGDEKEIWLSEVHNGMKMTYKADSNQLNHLQLLSTHATQNITYHCRNSVGYFDTERNNLRRSLKLLAWNDAELTAKNSMHLRYEMIEDGCKARSDTWSKTEISYTTEKSTRLPIIDVAMRDIGSADQEFAIEVGSVCFQTQKYVD